MKLSKIFSISLMSLSFGVFSNAASAMQYETCFSAQQSPICLIAFEKLQTMINPMTKERFFHNGVHITEGNELFLFPMMYVATPDLDQDGTPEIIVSVQEAVEEEEGQFCVEEGICPHYIIQDRALPEQNRTVSTYKAIGPIYAYAVGLSSDEVFDNFRSLRAYYDKEWQSFDVYQYDVQTDNFVNMSAGPQ